MLLYPHDKHRIASAGILNYGWKVERTASRRFKGAGVEALVMEDEVILRYEKVHDVLNNSCEWRRRAIGLLFVCRWLKTEQREVPIHKVIASLSKMWGETYYGHTGLCEKVVCPTSNSVNIFNLTVYYGFHEDVTVQVQVQPTSRYGRMHVSVVWDMSSEILYHHFPLSPVWWQKIVILLTRSPVATWTPCTTKPGLTWASRGMVNYRSICLWLLC